MFIVYIQHIYSFNVYTNFLYLVYLFIFAPRLKFNLKKEQNKKLSINKIKLKKE